MISLWKRFMSRIRGENQDERSFATGELEYERLNSNEEHSVQASAKPRNWLLVLAFLSLVLTGTANTVFCKLQAIPLYNYPNFMNLYGCAIYIPIFFAYVIPAYKYGWFRSSITEQQWNMAKRPFIIMGGLDCLVGMIQVFSAVYLPGPLLVLLPQAAIPLSMLVSRRVLKTKYQTLQYVGAIVVIVGICVVLEPEWTQRHKADYICEAIDIQRDCTICQYETSQHACLAHRLDEDDEDPARMLMFDFDNSSSITDDDDEGIPICEWIPGGSSATGERWLVVMWSGILLLSCVPMTISTIYKEVVLDDAMDPMFMSAWIVVYQTLYAMIFLVPAGMLSSPPVMPQEVPENLYDGFQCYLGHGTIEEGCHPDDQCQDAALYYNLALFNYFLYMLAIMFCVKVGSTSLLFLGLTIMVPLGNVVFAMPFMPSPASFHASDLIGLAVIMMGLVMYRCSSKSGVVEEINADVPAASPATSLEPLQPDVDEPSAQDVLAEPLLPKSTPSSPTRRTGDV